MLKVDSLANWRQAQAGSSMTFAGALPRTEVVRVRSSGPVNVLYTEVTELGEVAEKAVYLGTLQGDDAIRVSSPCGFRLEFHCAKGTLVTIYDDREAFASPSPETESFTVYEKRGLESLDPLDIIQHRQTVTARLQRLAEGPMLREQEAKAGKLEKQLEAMAARLAMLERPLNEEAQDGDGHSQGDASH